MCNLISCIKLHSWNTRYLNVAATANHLLPLTKQHRNRMLMMANELPEDLVIQILVWLPVVSLLRFKSVCKSWYALITNQNFITKHLLHNKNITTQLLLKTRDKTTEDYVVSTISYETLQVSLTHPLPPPCLGIDKISIFITGSCNGLVCLHDYRSVIWNSATTETKVVPKSVCKAWYALITKHLHNKNSNPQLSKYPLHNLYLHCILGSNLQPVVQTKFYCAPFIFFLCWLDL
jgi:hypothetical protein